jgi:sterol desaturase/sphingolipid hydroxylase (fatty acid hydroxylase superfamily)
MKKYDSIRIFQNPILEATTHVHPLVPLLMWVPIIGYLFYRSVVQHSLDALTYAALFLGGLLLWTLVEYVLHRWVFHYEARGPLGKRFVFLFHGLHHDDPHDPTRLVMPPVPAILIAAILYQGFSWLFPDRYLDALFASFMVGYLCYDYIHYATHHFAMTSKVGKFLRSYHLKHHFQHAPARFGVSNPLWDYLLGTTGEKAKNP